MNGILNNDDLAFLSGAERIAVERARQRLSKAAGGEGWDAEHDRGHAEELALAAACYAAHKNMAFKVGTWEGGANTYPSGWPWDPQWWKPSSDRIRELEKAVALIAAAIDALVADAARRITLAGVEGCFFCHRTRPIELGTYTLMDFGRVGIQNVCDDCAERADEPEEPDEWVQHHDGYDLVIDGASK